MAQNREARIGVPKRRTIGDREIMLVDAPGLTESDRVSQAAQLLASHTELSGRERVLVCPCGNGALGAWAAAQTDSERVVCLDLSIVAADVARRTLSENGHRDARVCAALPETVSERFDTVLMPLPKGRDLARLLFWSIYQVLVPGGRLYLAGPNKGGIKSAITDAEALYGTGRLLAYKGGNRVVQFVRPAESRSSEDLPAGYAVPGIVSGSYTEMELSVGSEVFRLRTRPGVFSWRGLDAGTRLLLEHLQVRTVDRVLDVGTGYGVIGLYAARCANKGHATLVDADILALECARENVHLNNITNAEVLPSDGLGAVQDRRFTLIVSNPPFHSGHQVSLETAEAFIEDAYRALAPRGRLVVVANRFLPYDHLIRQAFGDANTLAATAQYHVIYAEKRYQRKQRGKPKRTDSGVGDEETIFQIED